MIVSEEIFLNGFVCHQLQKKRGEAREMLQPWLWAQKRGTGLTAALCGRNVPQAPSQGSLELFCDSPALQGTRSTTISQIQSTVLAQLI